MNDVIQIAVGAVINALVGVLIWVTIQRSVDRRDSELDALKNEVKTLRSERVDRLAVDVAELRDNNNTRHAQESESRRGIHQEIALIQRDYITRMQLNDELQRVTEKLTQMESLATDLARVSENVKHATETMRLHQEQQLSLAQDLARLQGKMRA